MLHADPGVQRKKDMAGAKKQGRGYRNAIFGASAILRFLMAVLIVVVLIFLSRTAYRYGYSVFNETAMEKAPGRDVEVVIPEGASVRDIATILKREKLIGEPGVFWLQERFSDYHGKLADGVYVLNTSMKPSEMMAVMAGEAGENT